MSTVSYFQMFGRSIRLRSQHRDRFGAMRPTKRFYRCALVRDKFHEGEGWPKEFYHASVKLAAYSDACETNIRYQIALAAWRFNLSTHGFKPELIKRLTTGA